MLAKIGTLGWQIKLIIAFLFSVAIQIFSFLFFSIIFISEFRYRNANEIF